MGRFVPPGATVSCVRTTEACGREWVGRLRVSGGGMLECGVRRDGGERLRGSHAPEGVGAYGREKLVKKRGEGARDGR